MFVLICLSDYFILHDNDNVPADINYEKIGGRGRRSDLECDCGTRPQICFCLVIHTTYGCVYIRRRCWSLLHGYLKRGHYETL